MWLAQLFKSSVQVLKGPVASYNSRGRDESGDEPFRGDTGNKCITKGQVSSNCAFFNGIIKPANPRKLAVCVRANGQIRPWCCLKDCSGPIHQRGAQACVVLSSAFWNRLVISFEMVWSSQTLRKILARWRENCWPSAWIVRHAVAS